MLFLLIILAFGLVIVGIMYYAEYSDDFAHEGKHRGTYHHYHYHNGNATAGVLTPSQLEL